MEPEPLRGACIHPCIHALVKGSLVLRFRQRVLQRALLPLVTSVALVLPLAGLASPATADTAAETVAASADGPSVTGRPCAPGEGVTVEVDFLKAGATPDDPAQDRVALGCAEGPQESGFAALANAGFTTSSESGPGTICRIDGLPAEGMPYCWLSGGYWSYWRSNGLDPWAYSTVGAGTTDTIPVDSVEGWAFTMLDDPWESTLPRVAVADLRSHLEEPSTPEPAVPTVRGAACAPGAGVTTVVDYEKAGKNEVALACADGDQASGFAALEAAGHTLGSVPGTPGGLCTIDGLPAAGYPFCWEYEDANGYWGYYLEDGRGGWAESQLGGGDLTQPLAKGSVIGWHFGLYGDGWPNPPRITLDEVAEHAPEPTPTEPPTEPTPTEPPAVLGAARFAVTATTKPVVRGRKVVVKAAGLAPREPYRVRVAGRTVRTGKASAAGRVTVRVTVPRSVKQGTRRLTVVGSKNIRLGTRTLVVVKPRFSATVRTRSVRAGRTQVIRLKGLLPGETVVVRVNGKRVSPKGAKANRKGVYRLRTSVGRAPGRKVVKATSVKGRSGSAWYVVRR